MNCPHCDEPLLDGERVHPINVDGLIHLECLIRMTCGSVAHQQRRCRCFIPIPGNACGECDTAKSKRQYAREAHMEALRQQASVMVRHTDGVCGGSACIRETRITVWGLIRQKQLGTDDAGLLEAYPGISISDIIAAELYYIQNRDEIEQEIRENDREAA